MPLVGAAPNVTDGAVEFALTSPNCTTVGAVPPGGGGPEDEKWPEASPTQIADVMAISDTF